MVISDLVTDKEVVGAKSINSDNWCSCIDGALTKDNYIKSMRDAGFLNVEVLDEQPYLEMDSVDGRRITSLVIKSIKE